MFDLFTNPEYQFSRVTAQMTKLWLVMKCDIDINTIIRFCADFVQYSNTVNGKQWYDS